MQSSTKVISVAITTWRQAWRQALRGQDRWSGLRSVFRDTLYENHRNKHEAEIRVRDKSDIFICVTQTAGLFLPFMVIIAKVVTAGKWHNGNGECLAPGSKRVLHPPAETSCGRMSLSSPAVTSHTGWSVGLCTACHWWRYLLQLQLLLFLLLLPLLCCFSFCFSFSSSSFLFQGHISVWYYYYLIFILEFSCGLDWLVQWARFGP